MPWMQIAKHVCKWVEAATGGPSMKPDDIYNAELKAAKNRNPDRWVFSACLQGHHDDCYGLGTDPNRKIACSCQCHQVERQAVPKPFITLLCDAGQHALCMAPGTEGIPIPCNCRCHKDDGLALITEVLDWDGYEDEDRPAKEGEMRLENKKEITIEKARSVGTIPQFIALGQRHLEKERSASVIDQDIEKFILPVDLLSLYLDDSLVSEIEEIEIAYQRKS